MSAKITDDLVNEIARRSAAQYFDLGIDPLYLRCIEQDGIKESPVGRMIACVQQAFKNYIDVPLEHPEIPYGDYCYNIVEKNSDGMSMKVEPCPHHRISQEHRERESGYCLLTGEKDWEDGGMLWDSIKLCGYNLVQITEKS